jgi:hypothetical protein
MTGAAAPFTLKATSAGILDTESPYPPIAPYGHWYGYAHHKRKPMAISPRINHSINVKHSQLLKLLTVAIFDSLVRKRPTLTQLRFNQRK